MRFSDRNFPEIQGSDFKRLNDDDRWLSDSHVNFALRYVLYYLVSLSEIIQIGTGLNFTPPKTFGRI